MKKTTLSKLSIGASVANPLRSYINCDLKEDTYYLIEGTDFSMELDNLCGELKIIIMIKN